MEFVLSFTMTFMKLRFQNYSIRCHKEIAVYGKVIVIKFLKNDLFKKCQLFLSTEMLDNIQNIYIKS